MKQSKFFAFVMLAALALGINTSCSKDDEEVNKPVEGNGATLIKVIKDKDNNAVQLDAFTNGDGTAKYYYDASGRLNKMIWEDDGVVYKAASVNSPFNISYNENHNGLVYDWNTEISLNSEADITSYKTVEKTTATGTGKFINLEENATFAYDYSKQLKKIKISGKFVNNLSSDTNINYDVTIEFTWDSGNIKEGTVTEFVNSKESHSTIYFSYSSQKLNTKQMPYNFVKYGILGDYSLSDQLFRYLPFIGFGLIPQNVPSSVNGKNASVYLNSNGTISSESNCNYVYATK